MISARKDIIIIPTEDTNTETFLEAFTIIKIIIIIIIIIKNTDSYFENSDRLCTKNTFAIEWKAIDLGHGLCLQLSLTMNVLSTTTT